MVSRLLVALLEALLAVFPINAESAAHIGTDFVLNDTRMIINLAHNISSGNWY